MCSPMQTSQTAEHASCNNPFCRLPPTSLLHARLHRCLHQRARYAWRAWPGWMHAHAWHLSVMFVCERAHVWFKGELRPPWIGLCAPPPPRACACFGVRMVAAWCFGEVKYVACAHFCACHAHVQMACRDPRHRWAALPTTRACHSHAMHHHPLTHIPPARPAPQSDAPGLIVKE